MICRRGCPDGRADSAIWNQAVNDPIPFIDLQAQRKRLGKSLENAILAAVESGNWILGPQVSELEQKLARFAGVKHAIACANGTDALLLVLKAWEVGRGDAVFVPAFTFAATAEVVALAGATPVFVDVLPDSFNMDPASLEAAIAFIRTQTDLKPKAVIAVDLFGQPADYRRLEPIAAAENLRLLCDSAQSFGATLDGRSPVSFGNAGATSFFPAKPLGCYGDGGACFTNDDDLALALRSLRMHGQGKESYEHSRVGLNSRLDTIQAAILIEKLAIFADEIHTRQAIARRFNRDLGQNENLVTPRSDRGRPLGLGAIYASGQRSREVAVRPKGSRHSKSRLLSGTASAADRLADLSVRRPYPWAIRSATKYSVFPCIPT